MRTIIVLAAMVLAAAVTTSCTDAKIKKLKKELEQANSQCPIDVGGGMATITNLLYDETDNTVAFKMMLNEAYVPFSSFKDNPDMTKETFTQGMLLQGSNMEELTKLLQETHSGLKIILIGSPSNERMTVTLTPKELEKMQNDTSTPKERAQKYITSQVKIAKSGLPMDYGNGLALTDVEDKNTTIAYIYTVDEDVLTIDEAWQNLGGDPEAAKEVFLKELETGNPAFQKFANALVTCGKKLSYVYQGNKSEKKFDVTLSPEDMKKALQ